MIKPLIWSVIVGIIGTITSLALLFSNVGTGYGGATSGNPLIEGVLYAVGYLPKLFVEHSIIPKNCQLVIVFLQFFILTFAILLVIKFMKGRKPNGTIR